MARLSCRCCSNSGGLSDCHRRAWSAQPSGAAVGETGRRRNRAARVRSNKRQDAGKPGWRTTNARVAAAGMTTCRAAGDAPGLAASAKPRKKWVFISKKYLIAAGTKGRYLRLAVRWCSEPGTEGLAHGRIEPVAGKSSSSPLGRSTAKGRQESRVDSKRDPRAHAAASVHHPTPGKFNS